MTGPNYPPQPSAVPFSNEIGVFAIGRSPVGTIKPFDIWRTVMSQYANSPRLMTMIENFQDCIDQTKNIDSFFDNIINIQTAVGYGLDVWGRIVAVNRVLTIGAGPPYFGWDEGYPDWQPFGPGGFGPFYSGQKLTDNYILSDDGFRVLILAKAFSNICDGSIKSINRLLLTLFGTAGKTYVRDNRNMSFDYVFEFPLTSLQAAILTNSGVFPKPTGVSYTVIQI
jgi:hypothetical protein